MKKVLSIAGSDPSGGAGIQADIKTIMAHHLYAMTVITVLTAQNTTGVYGIAEIEPAFVENQMDCVFDDIFPDAVKIGMVYNAQMIKTIAKKLSQYPMKNMVLDPVMVATSGGKLLSDDSIEALKSELLPLAKLITPNIPEAECLSELKISTREDMEKAARKIGRFFKGSILVKGGHLHDTADDFLIVQGEPSQSMGETREVWLLGEKVESSNTHGTGCTLSSAIACNLAMGIEMETAVRKAKEYVSKALSTGLDLGKGNGPLNHDCTMRDEKKNGNEN